MIEGALAAYWLGSYYCSCISHQQPSEWQCCHCHTSCLSSFEAIISSNTYHCLLGAIYHALLHKMIRNTYAKI